MENIYTVKQTAKILGFSTNTVYKYLDQRVIEAARGQSAKARFRIPHTSLEKYLGTELSTDYIDSILNPDTIRDVQESQALAKSAKSFPIIVARLLIVAMLIILVVDLIFSRDFSLLTQLLRLIMVSTMILLAYQFGGYRKVAGNKPSETK